ncbi:MAG: DUF2937 family protein [Verrucomicrobia bacterium]|nr:DUF2937 family protein [Verrucomicrobiota bacterium]
MWKLVAKTFDRVFAVGGAFLFCQIPLLMHQYTVMLSGHLAESRRQINMLQHAASLTNKTLQEYIAKFLGQQDLDFVHQGEIMQSMQTRYVELNESYTALQHSTVWTKPFIFIKHIDSAVFWDSLEGFAPGLSLTLESLAYALIGLVVGVVIYRVLSATVKVLLFRKEPKNLDRQLDRHKLGLQRRLPF